LLLEGHGTARIAEKMVVSASTIKSHTYNIYGKMGVHSHQEMIDACEALRESGVRSEKPAADSSRRPGKRRVLLGASRNVA
jgi:spore cortex formation protein SpoVR/YcgB (stage V sporulation)